MKKMCLTLMFVTLASMIYAQELGFAMNLGVLTDKDFKFKPLVLSGGLEFDFHLGSYVMISPEVTFYTNSKFESGSLLLAPGISLNFKAGPLFLGGGVVKEFPLSSGGGSVPLQLKLNAGLRASKLRVGSYLLTPFKNAFKDIAIGFYLGFEF